MRTSPSPILDISLASFLIAVCLAVLWEARRIPPGVFEPLGSAPIPQATSVILILLCLAVLVRAVLRLIRDRGAALPYGSYDAGEEAPERPRAVFAMAFLTVGYVVMLSEEVASFAITTTVFLALLIGTLARFERRALVVAAIIAVAMGFGCQYVFTQIFVVDLPAS